MKISRAAVLLLTLLGCSAAGAACAATSPNEKKLIYYGWNTRDSLYVAQHWSEMEQMPFDGIAIGIALDRSRATVGDGSTGNLLGWQVFASKPFHLHSFAAAIADLQKPSWSRFTDNFLPLSVATRDQDQGLSWFDDARWAIIENNWRVLVTIAREGRCRGLLLDAEHYDYECELFNYADHRAQRADRSLPEYLAIARARGRQLGVALREVFPEITVGLLYGYTLPVREARSGDAAENARYALLTPFLDGLIEGAGAAANFVDLMEFAHGYKKRGQFLEARRDIQKTGSYPLQPGMSLRIDYPNAGSRWQSKDPEKNHFSPQSFEVALRGALEASDRYVWVYSEEGPQFFPPAGLPTAYVQAMRAAREPGKTATAAPLLPISLGLAGCVVIGLWIPAQRARRRSADVRGESLRVLIVSGIFPPDHGGPASYVPRIAAALRARGHRIEVICLSDQLDHDDSRYAFPVRRIRRGLFWPLRIVFTVFTIWRRARSNELIYVNGLGAEAALAAVLACRPTVFKVVGDYAWERAVGRGWFSGSIDDYQRAAKRFPLRLIDLVRTLPLQRARQVIVPSNYLRRIASGWGFDAASISVIPNAAVPSSVANTIPHLPPWSGKTLITVCRLVPWKGVEPLIRLLVELPETRLVVCGAGHLRGHLEAVAAEVGVSGRVLFLGDVPQSYVHGYLAQSDAFVLNSTYEGLPHVVLEAMAAGVPVIASDAGGTSEVVHHHRTGLLVPVGDQAALRRAVESLWGDSALGLQLVEGARAQLGLHFDFDAMVRNTEQALSATLVRPRLVHATAAEVKA